MPDSYATTDQGLLLIANGIDPVLRWDAHLKPPSLAGLVAPTTPVTGAGAFVGSLSGTGYIAYVTFVRDDGHESSFSPVSQTFSMNNNGRVRYTDIPVSSDSRVVARRIYRNTSGQASVVYQDVQIDDNTTTTALSDKSDPVLQSQIAYPLFGPNNVPTLYDRNPPPDTKPFCAWHGGRCFFAGWEDYKDGSCEVTQGSRLVIGRNTEWRKNWVGRFIYIPKADKPYEIDSVDVEEQTLTLVEVYRGETDRFSPYTIRPSAGECPLLYFSLPGEPESVPPTNAITIPEDDDEVTGIVSMFGFLYILKRRSIYRFTSHSDPLRDGFMFLSSRRGCLNARTFVVVNEAAFMMDERGVHRFTGGMDSEELALPIQDMFRRDSQMPINWQARRWFHASHSPNESTIRFFVSLRSDSYPRHCLAYNYSLNRWWIEEYSTPIAASAEGTQNEGGGDMAFYGVDAGRIGASAFYKPDYAIMPTAERYAVAKGGLESVTLQGFIPGGIVGSSICLIKNKHSLVQQRRIVKVTEQKITVWPAWTIMPEEGDFATIGGFRYKITTHGFRLAPTETTNERSAEIHFQRNAQQTFDVATLYDDVYVPENAAATILPRDHFKVGARQGRNTMRVDMSKPEGYALIRFDGLREFSTDGRIRAALDVQGVAGSGKITFRQIVIKGVVG